MLFKLQKNMKSGTCPEHSRGMTYVELIVVLSIFSIITGTIIFNYKQFQQKVDLANLANDIGLKLVDAQKSSTAGEIPFGKVPNPPPGEAWKPSYGLNFEFSPGSVSSIFYYFSDLDQNKYFDGITNNCPSTGGSSECLDIINTTQGYGITNIRIYYNDPDFEYTEVTSETDVSISFTRPGSAASIKMDGYDTQQGGIDFIILTLSNLEDSATAEIKIHASGKIEIN